MLRYASLTLAAASLVTAQTWSLCNPVKGDDCPPNPAFGGDASYNFRSAREIGDLESFFIVDGGVKYNPKVMSFSEDTGAQMTIFEEENAPTLTSQKYLFFGKVEVELQAAPGRGIVTSIVLQSDALDEIDWEFVGADQNHVQTNLYALGINDYTRARYYEVDFNPMTSFHTYTMEWTKEAIIFSIDGNEYRRATPDEGNYPQTPMQLKLGTWVGGKGSSQGTIDWAGGLAEWDNAPFAAYYRSLKIWDYAGGDSAGASQYEYNKGSDGTWQSIRIVGPGDQNVDGSHQPQQRANGIFTEIVLPAEMTSSGSSMSSVQTIANATNTVGPGSTMTSMTRPPSTPAANSTGSANSQTTRPATASGIPTQSPAPIPAAASAVTGGIFVACLAAFFAAAMM